MTSEQAIQLILQIEPTPGLSANNLVQMTESLQTELQTLRPEALGPIKEKAPEGSMAGDILTLGALAIAVLPTMIPALLQYLREWQLRNQNQTIKIRLKRGDEEIEVEIPAGMSKEKVREYIDYILSPYTGTEGKQPDQPAKE